MGQGRTFRIRDVGTYLGVSYQADWSVARAAWELGVSLREYREFEAGTRSPSFETWERICKLFGWPQTFAVTGTRGAD